MAFLAMLGNVAVVIFVYMSVFFGLAMWLKKNDIADAAWGLGFIVVTIASLLMGSGLTPHKLVVLVLVVLWGLRLAIHITLRNRGRAEDYRYRQWREDWGDQFVWRTFLQVFMLQGLFMLLVSFPIIAVNTYDRGGFGALEVLGIVIWGIGFFFETVGDYQLSAFKRDPDNEGKLLTSGLWRYTRHPNYFGEVTQWWGVFLIAVSAPHGWIGLVGSVTITLLILKVSGIPMLEKRSSQKPGWDEYRRRTNAFFPWFPKAADES